MKKLGRKGLEWLEARERLVEQAIAEKRLKRYNGKLWGRCEDCKQWKILTPDHKLRRSKGGSHDKSNIDWVCLHCHFQRDQNGDPMDKKKKAKKPDWMKNHSCMSCKVETSSLICHNCGRISIKVAK